MKEPKPKCILAKLFETSEERKSSYHLMQIDMLYPEEQG